MCNLKRKLFSALLAATMTMQLLPATISIADNRAAFISAEAAGDGETTEDPGTTGETEIPVAPAVTYSLKKIKGKWYCISSVTGKKVKGFRTIGNNTYYFNKKSGVMTKGWKKIGKRKYYFSKSGVMAKGWKKIKGKKYYFSSSGVMAKGWKTINGKRYYFNKKTGAMTKGWKKIGKHKYYFTGSGEMVTGWRRIKKKWYFFYSNGRMVKSKTIVIDGVKYKFKKNGVCTRKPIFKTANNTDNESGGNGENGSGNNNGGENGGGGETTPDIGYAIIKVKVTSNIYNDEETTDSHKEVDYFEIEGYTTNYHSTYIYDYHYDSDIIGDKLLEKYGDNLINYSSRVYEIIRFTN